MIVKGEYTKIIDGKNLISTIVDTIVDYGCVWLEI